MGYSYDDTPFAEQHYGTCSKTKRVQLDDETLRIFADRAIEIADLLRDVTDNNLSITRACQKRNVNMIDFRRALSLFETLHDNHISVRPIEIPLRKYVTFEEQFYGELYGCSSNEICDHMPPDATATIQYILESDVSDLSDREKLILSMRFQDGLSLRDCGKKLDVTAEYCRQVIARSLRKLHIGKKTRELLKMGVSAFKEAEHLLEQDRKYLIDTYREKMLASDMELRRMQSNYEKLSEFSQNAQVAPFIEMDVRDLELSIRATNGLLRFGCKKVRDVLTVDSTELMKQRNIGRGTITEIAECLVQYGFTDCYFVKSCKYAVM